MVRQIEHRQGSQPSSRWSVRLTILTLAHVVGTMQSVSVFAMAPVIRADMGLSTAQVGLFVSSYYFAQMCCALPAGMFVDRLGVSRSLVIAHGLLAGGSLCLTQAGALFTALLAMAMMGVGYAMVNPATALAVVDWFPAERRATAMGIKQTGVPVGGVAAAGLAMLVGWLSWRQVMLVVAAVTLAHLLCCLWLRGASLRRAPGGGLEITSRIVHLLRLAPLRRFALANVFFQIGQGNFFAYLTLFLRDVVMVNQTLAAAGMAVAQITSAVGRVGWGVLCDLAFRHRRAALVIVLCASAVIGLMSMAMLGDGDSFPALLLCAYLGVTIAAFAGLMLTVAAESVEPHLAATAVGFNLTAVYFGGVIGPPLFGLAMDYSGGYAGGWLFTGLLVLVGIVFLIPRWRRDQH